MINFDGTKKYKSKIKSLKVKKTKEEISLEGNNTDGELAFLRDIFLEAEEEYLEKLKSNPKYVEFIKSINKHSASRLGKVAVEKINSIETGNVKEEDLERVETEIVLILASIQDIVREKVREREKEEEIKRKKYEKNDEYER